MTTTGTTWDNLKLSLAGATEMPRNIIAHELHEWARMFPNDKMATGSVALICTNAMRGHVLWRSAFQAHRSRLPIRGLRPRLPSLRSVLPSRQIVLNEIFFAHELHELTRIVAMD